MRQPNRSEIVREREGKSLSRDESNAIKRGIERDRKQIMKSS